MTKKPTRSMEQILHEDWIEPWVERLNLGSFHLHAELVEKMEEGIPEIAVAVCITSSPYNSATIKVLQPWFEQRIEDGDDEEIEFVLVHELCHLVLFPLVNLGMEIISQRNHIEFDKRCENLCDILAVNFISLHHREKRGIVTWNS